MKKFLVISIMILLSACASGKRAEMNKIGSGTDEYKLSPCACDPIPMPNLFNHG